MNRHDQKELAKHLENPEFFGLYCELVDLSFRIQRTLPPVTAQVPKEHEWKEGKHTRIYIAGRGVRQTVLVAKALQREVEYLARRLSKFFPHGLRDYWQEIFITQAFHGRATVEGGRRGGPIPMPDEYKIAAVKEWREKKGLVMQENVAGNYGITTRTLRQWEKDLEAEGKIEIEGKV